MIRHGKSLFLIMSYVYESDPELIFKSYKLVLHILSELKVKSSERLIKEQNFKNFSEMLDKALDEYPEETLGVLAMCCFIPPEKADEQPVEIYFDVISDLLESEAVTRFFISLAKLGLKVGK
jgi:hypothetical protein